jgi:glutaredoxin 3
MKAVTIYTTKVCGFCVAAKNLLKSKDIPFQEIDVTVNPTLRQEIMQRSGQRTVPQIFFNEESIGGFTELKAISDRGELATKLAD